MSGNSHPILEELATQLPESCQLYLYIQGGKDYAEIATLAKHDIACLENLLATLTDAQTAESALHQNGYQPWLKKSDDDERLRVLGALSLIAELSEELADD